MDSTRRTQNRYPHLSTEIRAVISAFAQQNERRILLCQPHDVELRFYPSPGNPPWVGNNGKICYPNAANAHAAASAINAIDGADPVVAYLCPRGGHWHHVDAGKRARTALAIVERIASAARRAADRA